MSSEIYIVDECVLFTKQVNELMDKLIEDGLKLQIDINDYMMAQSSPGREIRKQIKHGPHRNIRKGKQRRW